ncbi:hypothetical protein BMS78_09830 [Leuconostoc pseudomesenteroides]|nr:hypothetical protein BMS78_09830 [Leuconostoc pseudomesenteroides]
MKPLLMTSLLFFILGITFLVLSKNENNKTYQFSGALFLIAGIMVATAQLIKNNCSLLKGSQFCTSVSCLNYVRG